MLPPLFTALSKLGSQNQAASRSPLAQAAAISFGLKSKIVIDYGSIPSSARACSKR